MSELPARPPTPLEAVRIQTDAIVRECNAREFERQVAEGNQRGFGVILPGLPLPSATVSVQR